MKITLLLWGLSGLLFAEVKVQGTFNSGSADGATVGQTAAGVSSGGSYELRSGFQNTLNRTSGCTDDTACNFNSDAGIDDGSCIYTTDCNGVCGGDALLDNCSTCDNDAAVIYSYTAAVTIPAITIWYSCTIITGIT
jgi:hypothetical protein